MENRLQIIKDFEALLKTTSACSDINIKYGYAERKYSEMDDNGKRYITDITFHESDRELNQRTDPREEVRLAWGQQSDLFAVYQSIESDSGVAIIKDIMKAIDKML